MAIKKQFDSFEDLLTQSPVPVLVDFYSVLCGPCRMMDPILAQVQASLKNRLQIVKIDSEKYTDLASRYHIHALPTLMLFKQGQPVTRIEGVVPPEELIDRLKPLI